MSLHRFDTMQMTSTALCRNHEQTPLKRFQVGYRFNRKRVVLPLNPQTPVQPFWSI